MRVMVGIRRLSAYNYSHVFLVREDGGYGGREGEGGERWRGNEGGKEERDERVEGKKWMNFVDGRLKKESGKGGRAGGRKREREI